MKPLFQFPANLLECVALKSFRATDENYIWRVPVNFIKFNACWNQIAVNKLSENNFFFYFIANQSDALPYTMTTQVHITLIKQFIILELNHLSNSRNLALTNYFHFLKLSKLRA